MKTNRWTNQGLARPDPLGRATFALILLLLAAAAWTPPAAGAKKGNTLLQFTSKGHVLGFGTDSFYIATGDHMMRIAWAGGRSVSPVAERCAGPGDTRASGQGQALERVSYPEVWNGVTVVYEKRDGAVLKSSYRIQAGATGNPVEQIRLLYNRPIRIDQDGDLVVSFERGEMREQAPVAWQETGGARTSVAVAYRLFGEREVGFEVGGYDRALPLIIDPTLTWNSFLGGSGTDYGYSITLDVSGNVYVAGYSTASWGSPIRAYTGGYDAFAAKLNGNGALQWNTFLGANGTDYGRSIAVDGSGNVYVAGYSNATWGSPIRAYTTGYDAFAAKLNSSGALTWNTFLGGSGTDYGRSIAVDSGGNVYVAGYSNATWGSPLRTYTTGYDAFAAKLNSSGALQWHTFLGGSGADYCYGISLDGGGNVYVAGYSTASWGSPVRGYSAGEDAFAGKLDSGGNLVWNLFLGGAGNDRALSLAVDGSRNVYATGYSTASWGSPVRAYSAGYDAFVAKIPETPTLIELASFGATPRENYIDLTWKTASEKDNLGFYLWRADGPSQDYWRITPALIPATGDAVTGAQYAYQDFDVIPGETYSYKLEDIDTSGVSAFHGPVSVVMGMIELLSPENGAKEWADSPVLFAWNGGPYSQFKLEFSSSADFTAPVLARPASGTKAPGEEAWTTETRFMPTLIEWRLIRALSAGNGVVYWHVRGKTTDGYEGASDANRLTIQLERRLAPDRPIIRK